MGIVAFLVLLVPVVWLLVKLRELQRSNDHSSSRIADLSLELEAVRKAFHRRVAALEEQAASLQGQVAPIERKEAATAPPSARVPEKPAVEEAPVSAGEPAPGAPAGQPEQPLEPAQPIWPDMAPDMAGEEPGTPRPSAPVPEPVGAGAAPPHPPSFESPPPRFAPPASPWEQIDWEQWIGVRGAALLGGGGAGAGGAAVPAVFDRARPDPADRARGDRAARGGRRDCRLGIPAQARLRHSTANALAGAGRDHPLRLGLGGAGALRPDRRRSSLSC